MKRLPETLQKKLWETMEHTAENDAMTMVVALSYSSRWEMTDAVREMVPGILADYEAGYSTEEICNRITEDTISQHLNTYFMPDPDLLIRTGGELRISNYLLWQIAYSELYFCNTYWPDFSEADLHAAIASYQHRQRRFGKTEAQVESEQSTSENA
jgi:undecaprenyl diphosphate synthase